MIHGAVMLGKDVVIDKTNMSMSSRARYISIAQSLDVDIMAIVFPQVSIEEHANRRFSSDNRGLSYEKWLTVASRFALIYEQPQESEGLCEILNL